MLSRSCSVLFLSLIAVNAFTLRLGEPIKRPQRHLVVAAEKRKDSNVDPLTKASWYAVEAFGKAFSKRNEQETIIDLQQAPDSLVETLKRLEDDNKREYFLSGKVDEMIYDEQCTFSDPFVSFQGRKRFVDNLANLGSFITQYSARQLAYTVNENEVQTKFMVKLELNLPWKPILAWPWGVKCTIDPESNLIVLHEETWDIEPIEGVKQIFRKPTTTISK